MITRRIGAEEFKGVCVEKGNHQLFWALNDLPYARQVTGSCHPKILTLFICVLMELQVTGTRPCHPKFLQIIAE